MESLELPDASGVFVTIKRGGALRGCLGTLQNRDGLAAEVVRCAADSATEDPRFPPVSANELPELSSRFPCSDHSNRLTRGLDSFTIGVHGLVAEQGVHRGLCCRKWQPNGAGTLNSSCARRA